MCYLAGVDLLGERESLSLSLQLNGSCTLGPWHCSEKDSQDPRGGGVRGNWKRDPRAGLFFTTLYSSCGTGLNDGRKRTRDSNDRMLYYGLQTWMIIERLTAAKRKHGQR